jgi:hypothetical protein
MKGRWWMGAAVMLVLCLPGSRVFAQDRGRDEGNRRDDDKRVERQDNQNRRDDHRFKDNERQAAREWYQQHRDRPPVGFRDRDRLAPDRLARLQAGQMLDRDLRKDAHPVPRDLLSRLSPAPRGYRYLVVGGHVVLVDDHYNVQDLIRFDIDIRP